MSSIVTTEQLMEFLGADSDAETTVNDMKSSALDEIRRATGADWSKIEDAQLGTVNELLRVMVYLSFYGVRDESKNLEHLSRRKIQLITMLQYSGEVGTDGI